jgi:hypothetical protein
VKVAGDSRWVVAASLNVAGLMVTSIFAAFLAMVI